MADDSGASGPILRPGDTVWRIARARRAALVVDAADYFRAVKAAILEARHSVLLIGWDFDLRIALEPDGPTLPGPNRLGPFLRWIARTRPAVTLHILKWDLGVLWSLGRGTTPLLMLRFAGKRNVRLVLDGAHPPGAAHHEKIVVVDDAIAFCGGIDMTADRWDTREHRDEDPRRTRPSGRAYGPWHDATMALDGEVAAALGAHARARWKAACGEALPAPPPRDPIWPDGLAPSFEDVRVGVARTAPARGGEEAATHEVERLLLAAIAAARRTLYVESQYFAARRVVEAIAARLREPEGPEIVVVNPLSAEGFLEAAVMDAARARLLALAREADRFGRFRILTPIAAGGADIYVHAKVLVVDDRLLRIGSSNVNNRSLGFDTECDVAVEALPGAPDEARVAARIRAIRADLLAEHLGRTPQEVSDEEARSGSLIAAIERLSRPGRTLVPYDPDPLRPGESLLAENELLDPERPPRLLARLRGRILAPFRERRAAFTRRSSSCRFLSL